MARSLNSRPWRTIGVLAALVAAIYGLVAGGALAGKSQWTPKLALDLEGGTEFVLRAVPAPGTSGTVSQSTIDEAVKIIRQRVDGSGIAEAEVTTQGSDSIVVSLPGKNIDQATKDAIEKSAAMEFRPVLGASSPQVTTPTPTGSSSTGATSGASPTGTGAAIAPSGGVKASGSASATGSAGATAGATGATAGATGAATAAPSSTSNGAYLPPALLAATPSPTSPANPTSNPSAASTTGAPSATSTAGRSAGSTGSGSAGASASGSPSPAAAPTDASDTAWITQAVATAFGKIDCTTKAGQDLAQKQVNDPKKPFIACEDNGVKYVLGPVEIEGKHISGASASLQTNSQGQTGTAWQVNLSFDGEGANIFADVTARLFSYGTTVDRNRFAIVLDNKVISAPQTLGVISGGEAQITGGFDQASATSLANQLKFGALPISFQKVTEAQISATLGDEQLRRGLLAGLIGLVLVVLYSLLQYRALGLVTVSSLVIAGVITWGMVVLLGWRQGLRLSLPGVAGLIVAIGITADSFIVYFERIRDEVRDGRPLLSAVELAWQRARRTILISDAVSFLAAVVLYLLAVGGVRGFAFTLGLTTVVDIAVVFGFTKPTVTLLARTRFFGSGHRLSGFDADHLGRAVVYTGRGRTRPTAAPAAKQASAGVGATIAERRAAAERAARGGVALLDGDPPDPTSGAGRSETGDPAADTSGEGSATTSGRDA